MFKKLAAVILAFGLAVSVVPQVNAAPVEKASSTVVVKQSPLEKQVKKIVKETNKKVEKMIKEAQKEAKRVTSEKELDKIIKNLQKDCGKVTNQGIKELKKLGVHAECEYIEVTIGWKTVLIDPIKVVW
ncbi:MAG: hypothetical protein ACI35O_06045 [Bacillaceae bacterium]